MISISIPNVITIGIIALLWVAGAKFVASKTGYSASWL